MDPNIIIQNQEPPQHVESDLERFDRYQREAAEKNRQQEPYSVRSARTAYESAKAYHEQVNRPYSGNKHDYAQQRAAELDLKEKEQAYRKASNDHTRAEYLGKLEAEKKAKADARAAEDAKAQKQAEADLRAQYLVRWKAAGGTEESFSASWPSVYAEHMKQQVLNGHNTLLDQMRSAYGGRF